MATEPAVPDVPDLVLRPATTDDAGQVTELYLATRRAAEPAMPPQLHSQESVLAFMTGAIVEKEVWVAERDEIVGFAVLAEAFLDALYVGPDHQGFGIGNLPLGQALAGVALPVGPAPCQVESGLLRPPEQGAGDPRRRTASGLRGGPDLPGRAPQPLGGRDGHLARGLPGGGRD